jgi:steroid delta-isomerase-like uncharacterized protein
MTIAESKAIVRRFYEELWNERRIEIADEIFAPDCVTHQLQSGSEDVGAPRNAEAIKHHVAAWLAGFADLRFEVEEIFAEADRVVSRCVAHGTHTGTWFGIKPTGKPVSIRMVVIHRVKNGKIAEDWVLVESLGFLQQLGLLPPITAILESAVLKGPHT